MKISKVICAVNNNIYSLLVKKFPQIVFVNYTYEYQIINAVIVGEFDVFIYQKSVLMGKISEKSLLMTVKGHKDIYIIKLLEDDKDRDIDFDRTVLFYIDFSVNSNSIEKVFDIIGKEVKVVSFNKQKKRVKKKILLGERDESYKNLIKTIFRDTYDVIVLEDGNKIVEFTLKERPDLVILSLELGDLDAFTVANLIRYHARTKEIPIILFTEVVDHNQKRLALESGITDIFSKFDSPENLVKRIDELLTEIINTDKKILIIEDSNSLAHYLKYYLKKNNFYVEIAYNGFEGLQKAYSINPNLILLDLEMPILNGFQFIRIARDDQILKDIPIIVMSGIWKNKATGFYLKELGIRDFLVKPINEELLLNIIEKHLKFRQNKNKKSKYFTVLEIMLKINNIMERTLFQLFYIDKIRDVGIYIYNLKEFFEKLAYLLNNILIIESGFFYLNLGYREVVAFFMKDHSQKRDLLQILNKDFYISHNSEIIEYLLPDDENIKFDNIREAKKEEKRVDFFDNENNLVGTLFVSGNFTQFDDMLFDYIREYLNIYIKSIILIEKVQSLSLLDYLTRIYNKRFFDNELSRVIEYYKRYNDTFSLIMFDIDHFKKVNDVYGHYIGDYVLKTLAGEIKKIIRIEDIFCRVGGEEFIIILPKTGLNSAAIMAEKIRVLVENLKWDFTEDKITISLGVTEVKRGDTEDIIYKRVDEALYNAKKNGRNQVQTL